MMPRNNRVNSSRGKKKRKKNDSPAKFCTFLQIQLTASSLWYVHTARRHFIKALNLRILKYFKNKIENYRNRNYCNNSNRVKQLKCGRREERTRFDRMNDNRKQIEWEVENINSIPDILLTHEKRKCEKSKTTDTIQYGFFFL